MAKKGVVELMDAAVREMEETSAEPLLLHDGVLYPAAICRAETLNLLDTFKARSDDVVLVGYPKTGTNWIGQVLTQLEEASGKYDEEEIKRRKQIEQESRLFPYLEFGDPEKFERMEKLPSRRILKTHLRLQKIPKSIFEKKAKILVLFRNPKDVAVSYFHFAKGMKLIPNEEPWDKFFADFINGKVCYGLYLDYIIEWNKYLDDKNVMFITYEEVQENTALGLKRIAEFFDFSVTEQDIQSIVEQSSFKAMKEKFSQTHGEMGKSLFRKGIVGDWRNVFTEAQSKEMDKKYEEDMAKIELGRMLKYEVYCKN